MTIQILAINISMILECHWTNKNIIVIIVFFLALESFYNITIVYFLEDHNLMHDFCVIKLYENNTQNYW